MKVSGKKKGTRLLSWGETQGGEGGGKGAVSGGELASHEKGGSTIGAAQQSKDSKRRKYNVAMKVA